MTRIAFHADQLYYEAPGGIGTYIRELVQALSENPSLEITLFHAGFRGPEPPEDWMRLFPIRPLSEPIQALYPWWNTIGRPKLPRDLSRHAVLHAPSPASIPPPGRRQRLVVTVHDLAFRLHPKLFPRSWRILFRTGLRRAVRKAEAILVPSQNTARDLLRLTRVRPAKVHVVPLAASLPATSTDPEPVLEELGITRPYILFVGTLEPRKNLLRMVRAYRLAVGESDLPHALVLAGPEGWGVRHLLKEVSGGGGGKVILTGRTEPAKLDALYRGADLFAYPSLYEGFGLPVIEAMARGVPTIVSDSSSLPEVVGRAALSVDAASVTDLAEAIERLLTDRMEAEELRQAGLARAEQFSWARTAQETLKVYESVL